MLAVVQNSLKIIQQNLVPGLTTLLVGFKVLCRKIGLVIVNELLFIKK